MSEPPFVQPILRDFPDSIETERLLIRAPRPGDGAVMNEAVLESMNELRPWLPWAETAPTLAESEGVVRRMYAKWQSREDLALLLFLREDGTFLGGSGLHRIDWSVPKFEIGYWLRTSRHGRGYMTEAVRAIAGFAFATRGAGGGYTGCDAGNERSAAVARRAGFEQEARLRNFKRHHLTDELVDELIFSRVAPAS